MSYSEESLVRFFKIAKKIYTNEKFAYQNKLRDFFIRAKVEYKAYKKIKREVDRYLSTDFNFMKILSPDENKLSDLIKILLEPEGIHGQGTKFLKLFLEILSQNVGRSFEYEPSKVKIEREKATDKNRRIDLFIDLGEFVIAIENKPWAGERESQVEDYFNWLQEKYGDNFLLIYLHGTGEEPTSIRREAVENNRDKLLFTSYHKLLRPWLEKCYRECESQKVRFFIKDFIDWIKENFREQTY